MSDYWDNIIDDAANDAMETFSEKLSSHTKLTVKEIEELVPGEVDKAKLAELMKVVDDASKSNQEKAEAIRNTAGYAEIAANLLVKLI